MHLWLGLATGLIVLIVGLTGCILVFEEEISELLGVGVFQQVDPQNRPLAPPSQVFELAEKQLEGKNIQRAYYSVYMNMPRVNAFWALDSEPSYHAVLQDPYSGAVLGSYHYNTSFFATVLNLHMTLGLGQFGEALVKYGTLIFVFMMLTGLFLWVPASKKGYRQRFTIKWNAKGKRLNYDLHNVLGFYMSWVAIFIALTGLVWSFEWMDSSVQWVVNGGRTVQTTKAKIVSDTIGKTYSPHGYLKVADSLFTDWVTHKDDLIALRVFRPDSPEAPFVIFTETKQGDTYDRIDKYAYDQYSGALLSSQKFSDMPRGDQFKHMNYYIHVGSIAGLTGKFMAFFACLIASSLPITGFLIWQGRRRKKRR